MRLITFTTRSRVHLAYFWRTPGRSHMHLQGATLEECFEFAPHLIPFKHKLKFVTEADFNEMVK
jgi:hypothetical protein